MAPEGALGTTQQLASRHGVLAVLLKMTTVVAPCTVGYVLARSLQIQTAPKAPCTNIILEFGCRVACIVTALHCSKCFRAGCSTCDGRLQLLLVAVTAIR